MFQKKRFLLPHKHTYVYVSEDKKVSICVRIKWLIIITVNFENTSRIVRWNNIKLFLLDFHFSNTLSLFISVSECMVPNHQRS